jgi:dienelactone hydrolase
MSLSSSLRGASLVPALILALVAAAATPAASGQAFGSPGPHLVGLQELKLNNPLAGTAKLRIQLRYPALSSGPEAPPDLAQGPYPLVVFGHANGSTPAPYGTLLDHFASWGFAVAAPDTATWGPQALLAQDMLGTAAALDLAIHSPASSLAQLIAAGPVGYTGHSMGGGAAVIAGAMSPAAGAVLALSPWNAPPSTPGVPAPVDAAPLLGTPFSIIVGALDAITPVSTNSLPLYAAASSVASVRALSIVAGAGHNDPLLFGQASNDGTAFLRAYLTADSAALDEVYGPSAQSDPEVMLSFEVVDPDCFVTGTAAPGEVLGVHVSGPAGSALWCLAAAEAGAGGASIPCLELPQEGLVVLSSGIAGATQLVSLDVVLPPDLFGLSQLTWFLQGLAALPDGEVECSPVRTLTLQPAP